MKVEFLVNQEIGDGCQIFIEASEFRKAAKDEEEFNSFAFATESFFKSYDMERYIDHAEYDFILTFLSKTGAVIITVEEIAWKQYVPAVYISINNRLKKIDLDAVDYSKYIKDQQTGE